MEDYIKMLYNIGYKRFYHKEETLFYEGENPKNLFVLLKGKISLYKSTEDNKEKTIHQISSVSFIAEMPTFLNIPYPASAMCIEECEVLEIGIKTFKRLCQEDSNFCLSFIASLCNKIKILENHISQNSKTIEEKLKDFLLQNQASLPTLTQKQIAKNLNISPESLSRVLKNLKAKNLIKTQNGKIIFMDTKFINNL
ncbi:Crp/Fnr family transcriptional regulator [Helicobacter mesocricetorum]|uniref:Crp/Fnr family transcriptional regulator n=1 Tax=Helicobacter mesocricetorum TaxID=87012 RepID=UPI000CF17B77|nr:Crp/Fnr family transcriptional regulator [Helicobacter mesocricetorum]